MPQGDFHLQYRPHEPGIFKGRDWFRGHVIHKPLWNLTKFQTIDPALLKFDLIAGERKRKPQYLKVVSKPSIGSEGRF
jgi:hypothetical protein